MRVLVVHAHPRRDSFNHALFDLVVTALTRAGHEVESISLYEEEFDPRMTADERIAYHTATPIRSAQVERHAQLVVTAEALVFVYPTWWFGLPAILKGWLERVMVPGVAFVFAPENQKVMPNLLTIRRIVGVTTYGSSWWYSKLFNDAGRRTLVRTLRLVCNPSTRSTWLGLYSMDRSAPQQRLAFLGKVERTLGGL
jgi:NAD(P)H dehydrogenase (quinone)